jgi:hypothetical protein
MLDMRRVESDTAPAPLSNRDFGGPYPNVHAPRRWPVIPVWNALDGKARSPGMGSVKHIRLAADGKRSGAVMRI